MLENNFTIQKKYSLILSLLSAIIFIYIILFEFILPVNQILPRPSILIESIPSILKDYSFINNYLFTVSIIYSIFLVSYFLIKLVFPYIFITSNQFPKLHQLFQVSNYFLPVFLIFLFNIWFDNSVWGEIIFIFILTMGLLKSEVFLSSHKVKDEYIISAKSLGLPQNKIIQNVIWKSIQPQIFDVFKKNHFLIWTYTLVYEFVNKTNGLGKQFYLSVKYTDLVVIVVTIISLIIILFIFEFLMNKIKLKYFFWEKLDE